MLRTLLAVTIAAACGVAGVARAQPASSYQLSCNNIGAAGSTLFADCRRINGTCNKSQIQIPGVENIDGNLRYR